MERARTNFPIVSDGSLLTSAVLARARGGHHPRGRVHQAGHGVRRRPTGYCRVEQGTSIKRTRADRASRTRRNTAPSSETSGVQSKKPTIRAAVFVDFFASRFLRVFSCFGAFVKGSNDAKNNSSHLSLSRPLIFAPTAATAADPGIRRRRCALADVRHPARRREGRGGGGGWGDGAGRAAAGRRI